VRSSGAGKQAAFRRKQGFAKIIVYKNKICCVLFVVWIFLSNTPIFPNNKIRTAPMSALTLNVAVSLAGKALAFGREISAAPLTIAVLDAGGHLVTLQREDGASLLRPQIAIGKAWGAIALGKGSRLLALDAQQRPAFIAALNSLGQGSVVPAPGGVLIRDQQGAVVGAIGISGDTSDIDEQCAISAIEAQGLQADAGVSV
jgi:uncharacterized protein GlcG (DUF336 family)